MTATVLEFSTRAPLRFVPLLLEVEPILHRISADSEEGTRRRNLSHRIIAMAKAMAAYLPADQQDEAYRDGLRALRGER